MRIGVFRKHFFKKALEVELAYTLNYPINTVFSFLYLVIPGKTLLYDHAILNF